MAIARDFEQQLGAWLREDSAHRVPGHLGTVLVRTAATPQRRWWSSPRRWLPIDRSMRPPIVAPGRVARVLVVVAIIVALIAAALFVVGSHQRRLPPPFGLARNGTFVTGINGDLFAINPSTGATTPLAGNTVADFDFGPGFSRDGTRLFFLRSVEGRGQALVVADPDGRDAKVVTPFVEAIDTADWSPDGSRFVYLSRTADGAVITVANADGTNARTLDLPFSVNIVSWLPPAGDNLLFRSEHLRDFDPSPAIYLVHPDGTGLRRLTSVPAADVNDYQDVSGSPDGRRILYREVPLNGPFRIHVLDLVDGTDRALPMPEDAEGQTSPGFSPDGSHVVYLRFYPAGLYLVVAPTDGSTTGVVLPLQGSIGNDGPTINNYGFTPDGTEILANDLKSMDEWLLPVDGSPGTLLVQGVVAYDALTSVQRLAP